MYLLTQRGCGRMPIVMRHHATRLVGQRVIVHHVNGTAYHGILHSVTDRGIYMMNARGIRPASAEVSTATVEHALADADRKTDVSEAFFPFFFLAFAALAGLAAASAYYPYGYYPYGYYY
jgi:Ataxin 2 SM domain